VLVTSERELDVLLHAYAAERADDAEAAGTVVALFATSVGLLTLIGFILIHHKSGSVPGWAIALAPLLPFPFLAYGAMLAHLSNARGQIIDIYEKRIQERLGGVSEGHVPAPFGHTLISQAWKTLLGGVVVIGSSVVFIGLYVAVLIESFRDARNSEYDLALMVLVACSLAVCAVIVLTVLALQPDFVSRGLERMTNGES
jgi:hypothetical protein